MSISPPYILLYKFVAAFAEAVYCHFSCFQPDSKISFQMRGYAITLDSMLSIYI